MSQTEIKYPDVHVRLVDKNDNPFSILRRVQEALLDAGLSNKECKQYIAEATGSDYDHMIHVTMSWVTVIDNSKDDYTDYHDSDNGDH